MSDIASIILSFSLRSGLHGVSLGRRSTLAMSFPKWVGILVLLAQLFSFRFRFSCCSFSHSLKIVYQKILRIASFIFTFFKVFFVSFCVHLARVLPCRKSLTIKGLELRLPPLQAFVKQSFKEGVPPPRRARGEEPPPNSLAGSCCPWGDLLAAPSLAYLLASWRHASEPLPSAWRTPCSLPCSLAQRHAA